MLLSIGLVLAYFGFIFAVWAACAIASRTAEQPQCPRPSDESLSRHDACELSSVDSDPFHRSN